MSCSFEDCQDDAKVKGMCTRCYARVTTAERRGGYKQVGDFCKKGHKIEGDNAQFYMNHGVERVRCAECNKTPATRVSIGDKCKYGHIVAGENLSRIKRDGKEFFRCRECSNERHRERRRRAVENGTIDIIREYEAQRKRESAERRRPSEYAKSLKRADKLLASEVKKGSATFNSLKYLKLGKRASQASQALEDAFDRARAKCYSNPAPYIDYDEGEDPRPIDAYRLCEGCPLMVECGRFAAAYRPPIGVWAGEVWVDGKVKK
jgi:hypothetical protein